MDIYILDQNLLRTEVVESFESMIWTERYSAFGDFILELDPNLAESPLYTHGTYLAIGGSERVMYIDYTELTNRDDGSRVFRVQGKSLEAKLRERALYDSNISTGSGLAPFILGPDTPASMMRWLFNATCRSNTLIPTDNIPFIQADNYSSTGHIPEPTDSVTIQTEIDTLYNVLKSIGDVYGLGFRLVRRADDSKLYFDVYTGYDRTTTQTVRDAVVFSTALDNLTATTDLTSSEQYKNVAYVYAPNGSRIVYSDDADANTSGFNKKILIVNANDIEDAAGSTLNAKLDQRGKEELAKNRTVMGFDGEIPQNGPYVYGTHYFLGDLVEKRSTGGSVVQMRVTEQIFVSDKEGEKSYPTLTFNEILVPGSWDAVPPSKYWDIYTTEVWDSV